MSDIYSEYVRSLAAGEPPVPERDEEVCRQLRTDLRWAMLRRGLWHAPPTLLGAVGTMWNTELLEDLVHDAYLYNFADRLWHLNDRLELGFVPSGGSRGGDTVLRPLVVKNLENFLSERQKAVDPIGRRIFVRLRESLRGLLKRGELKLLNAAPNEHEKAEINNLTLLGLRPGLAAVALPDEVEEAVYGWDEELFAQLVSAETQAVTRVVERLDRRVLELETAGIEAFRFKDLVDPLKRRARRWWEAAVAEDLGETATAYGDGDPGPTTVVFVRPDDEPDAGRRFVMLLRCVSEEIAELEDLRTRDQLWRLWEEVRSCAARDAPRPSFSQLSRELGIPRERRLPKLFAELGEIVESCRRRLGAGKEPKRARAS